MINKKNNNIVIILLLLVLVTLTGCINLSINQSYIYNDENYKTGNMAFTEDIECINIDWIVGNVYICPSENNELIIREEVDIDIDDIYKMHYLLEDKVLDIKFVGSAESINYNYKTKNLYLFLPTQAKEINIENVSSDINIELVNIIDLNIDNVSGSINLENSTIKEFEINNISGEIILFDSAIEELEINSVSGNIGLSLSTLPLLLEISTTSANITFYIQDTDNISVEFETISGKFESNLNYVINGKIYEFNKTNIVYEIETISGSLRIKRKK